MARAVVLRRGPTDWARLSVWHTDTDRFDHGQWIKGRVYERRSDLSADGSLFAAFVRQSGARKLAAGTTEAGSAGESNRADTWIALSRPPYFTASAVWFVGGTYHTGAFFPSDEALWIGFQEETAPDVGTLPTSLTIEAAAALPYIDGTPEWTERTVHFNRLLRDGWRLLSNEPRASLWERPHPSSSTSLTMMQTFEGYSRFGGPYAIHYSVTTGDGRSHEIGAATWADWDHRGRLVAARDGRLHEWRREGDLHVIEDFNGQEPDPQPAPVNR